jgi:hypothetical protein
MGLSPFEIKGEARRVALQPGDYGHPPAQRRCVALAWRHCVARSPPLKVANGGVDANRRLVSLLHSVNVQLAPTLRPAFLGLSPVHANSPRIDTAVTRIDPVRSSRLKLPRFTGSSIALITTYRPLRPKKPAVCPRVASRCQCYCWS